MKRPKIRVGDVFEIPLSDGRRAYGRYYHRDPKQGPIIEVFNVMADNKVDVSSLRGAKRLFPPLIAGLFVAIREGIWKVVGHLPIENFRYPGFISAHYGGEPLRAQEWFFWDGFNYIKLGERLPKEYQGYEYLAGWAPADVVRRIETGYYPSHLAQLLAWESSQVDAYPQQKDEPAGQ